VPNEHEAMVQGVEEEAADEELLIRADADIQRVGIAVRQRVIDFLWMHREGQR